MPGLGSLLRLASAALALLAGVLPAAEGANQRPRVPGRLAVVQGGDDSRIKLMHADGSHATTLVPAEFGVGSPTWRPDGRALAFVTSSRAPGLFLVNDDGTNLRPLIAGGGGDPSFSRDGRFIAYTRGGDIFVARADGTRPRRLVKQGLENLQPTWSPNGRQIVFVRLTHEFGADLYLLTLATRTTRRLTTGNHDVSPAWSPRGGSIAFVRQGITSDVGELYLTRPGGSGIRPIAPRFKDVTDATWSPDGRELAFTRKIAPDSDIFRLELATGRVRKVTCNSISDTEPAWGPPRR